MCSLGAGGSPSLAVPGRSSPALEEALGGLEDLSSVDRPKKVGLLATPFSIEDGTLTLTDKVKRRVVQERYAPLIDRFYADGGEGRVFVS